jgi:hypothetical protein
MEVAIGQELLPVLEQLMPEIRDIAREFGTTLKNAVKAVDWKALLNDLVAFGTWFVNNVETIARVTTALFLLNTTVKALNVVFTAGQLILTAYTYVQAKLAAGATIATLAVSGLRAVMLAFAPFAIAAGIAAIATAMVAIADNARLASAETKKLYEETKADLIANPWKQAANPTKVYIGLIRDAKSETDGLKTSLENLPKEIHTKITLSAGYASAEARRMTEQAYGRGSLDMSLGKWEPVVTPGPTGAASGSGAASQTFQQSMALGTKQAAAQGKLQGLNFSQGYIDGLLGTQGGLKQANALIKKATALPLKKQTALVAKENKKFAGTIGEVNRVAAENAARDASAAAQAAADLIAAQQAAQAAEAAALAERERVYNSFLDSVKNTFAGIKNAILGAFDLPQLGGSTNAITRNMDKLLVRLRAFAANISKLSGMGLNPALLQQVISAGPMAGARLAESLVMGGTGALAAINAGYNEFGVLSGQIAQTGTESLFNQGAQQTVYNINVDGGVGSGSTIGKAIVDAIKAYERTSGAVWQGA